MHKVIDLGFALIDQGLVPFLILYALFCLGEVMHHLEIALTRFREKWTDRHLRDLLVSGVRVLVALGPLYVSLEVLERLAPLVADHV
jgi:hypothetical protein